MKHIARFLLLVMVLTVCAYLCGCSDIFEPTWRKLNSAFMVSIKGISQQNVIDFEITNNFYICVTLFDVDDAKSVKDDIVLEYNEDNTDIGYAYAIDNRAYYLVYLYELENDNELSITYNGKTITIKYNILDYDFENHGWVAPSSLDDLNIYPEFKEMLLSLQYHEFEAPYVGLPTDENKDDFENGYWYYYLTAKDDVTYLDYLTDSAYYPSVFSLVNNDIGESYVYMEFQDSAIIAPGAPCSTMNKFLVAYNVIPTDCPTPIDQMSWGLESMSFSARNKDKYLYKYAGQYPNAETILLEKYLDKFYQYRLDDVTVYILMTEKNGVKAYFIKDNYFYEMYVRYGMIRQ